MSKYMIFSLFIFPCYLVADSTSVVKAVPAVISPSAAMPKGQSSTVPVSANIASVSASKAVPSVSPSAMISKGQLPKTPALKIKVVDINALASNTMGGQEIKKKIDDAQRGVVDELKTKSQQLQRDAADLENQKQKNVISPEAYTQKMRDLQDRKLAYDSLVQHSEEDLRQLMNKAQGEFIGEVQQALAEFATKEDIDLIYDKIMGTLVYSNEELNVTANIADAMNKTFNKKIELAAANKNSAPSNNLVVAHNADPKTNAVQR